MYFYLYKITNWFNGKIYVGVHKTEDLDDGYMGSGKYLKRAQEKYGVHYFTKEVLQVFDSQEEMFNAESQVVNEEFVQSKWTYNLRLGGRGGWSHLSLEQRRAANKTAREKIEFLRLTNEEYRLSFYEKRSLIAKKLHKEGKLSGWPDWTGRKHTEETKRKLSKISAERNSGETHPLFGKSFIYNIELEKTILVDNDSVSAFLEKGWKKGRKKFSNGEIVKSKRGTCWIYSESKENKLIYEKDLDLWLTLGWVRGRVLHKK